MKTTTVLKVLKRYEKSLAVMENEALKDGCNADAGHYRNDRLALMNAIKIIEGREGET